MAEIDTVESYDGDFVIRLEFRATRGANSGLHLRDKAFAHQLQIRDYPRVGPYKTLRGYKDEDWNAIEVIVEGNKARCTCNGELLEAAPHHPREGAARPPVRDQRGRIPEHPDQDGGATSAGPKRNIP